jgi:hypothetical protein
MQTVLDNPNNIVRDYLRENLGTISGRNAVRNPFVTQIDLRYSQKLPSVRGQRAELTVDVFNFASLLNHSWGGVRVVPGGNQTLLRTSGFDATTQNWRYTVNQNFGQSVLSGNRYQVQAGVRYSF